MRDFIFQQNMQKGIGSKKTLAHSGGRHEDRLNEGVSSEVDSRYSEAFLSYEDHDETSSGLSYESDELVFESSSSTHSSAAESDGSCSDDDTTETRSKCSAFSSTSNSSSDLVMRRRGKYSGLSHFEQYCKKRQRRAMTDGTIDKIMKNNQVGSSTERKTCEEVAASSFHEEYLKKEGNRSSPAVIVKGLKAPKKLGFLTRDGPKVKAPSCVVVAKYTDDISILSEPATAVREKVTKRPSSNLTKPHDPRHLEDKDQSSHHEYRKNIKPARESDDDGMSSSTSYTGLDRSGILDDRLDEEKHPVHHLNRDCVHSSDDEMDKQSNSSVTFSLNRNNAYSQQIHTNNTGDQHEINGFSSKDFQKSAQNINKLHSPSNKFLQSNFRKFTKSSILKLRGRKGVHIGRTMDEYEQTDDQAKVMLRDDLEINEDGSIKNKKIVYRKFGGNPEIEMKLVESHENLVPASNSSKVVVRVEASTVSMMDSKIRRSLVKLPFLGDDEITPGIDVVGIVQKCGDEATTLYGINQNDMVASLVGIGGNAAFVCLDASKVVRLPSGISDTSAAAVVIETYFPAFQALVYGLQSDQRYSSSCLQGRNVLITGGISNLGQALIQLALYFGAAKVYTTAISKHHAQLTSLGAIPVDASLGTMWCDQIDCHIDLAISNHSLANIHDFMNYGGKIVFLGEGTAGLVGLFGSISDFILLRIRGLSTFTYDMFYEWENDMETSKKDLSYLFGLLRLNRITPQVTRTVGLKNVPKAHVYLESKKRVQGTMVCLPSKR